MWQEGSWCCELATTAGETRIAKRMRQILDQAGMKANPDTGLRNDLKYSCPNSVMVFPVRYHARCWYMGREFGTGCRDFCH